MVKTEYDEIVPTTIHIYLGNATNAVCCSSTEPIIME